MSVSSTRPVYMGLTAIPTFTVMKEKQAVRFIDVFLTAMGQQWSPMGKVAYMVGTRVTRGFKTQCYHIRYFVYNFIFLRPKTCLLTLTMSLESWNSSFFIQLLVSQLLPFKCGVIVICSDCQRWAGPMVFLHVFLRWLWLSTVLLLFVLCLIVFTTV